MIQLLLTTPDQKEILNTYEHLPLLINKQTCEQLTTSVTVGNKSYRKIIFSVFLLQLLTFIM